MMTLTEIYENLCYNDPRNPHYNLWLYDYDLDEAMPEPRKNCSCDNCFYGRDKLAMEILRLMKIRW